MEAAITLGSLGLVFALGLGIASRYLAVTERPDVEAVNAILPQLNCGGCGYPNCMALAKAMVDGKESLDTCVKAGHETTVRIGEMLGQEVSGAVIAVMKCGGGWQQSKSPYQYLGAHDCRVAVSAGGGAKDCAYGCIGLGTCAGVCPSNAIVIGKDGLPKIDRDLCVGCGVCVRACPRKVIDLVPIDKEVIVACKNVETGRLVRSVCSIGCVGCKACARACQYDAIHVTNNLAKIDYAKCTNCRACALKCPTHAIQLHLVEHEVGKETGAPLQTVG
jgi:Na+-translocating ferredoxin:NAD+ oxidoreductase subunit B